MALRSRDPCPRCNRLSDIHDDLCIPIFEDQSVPCYCNFCGMKLCLKLSAAGKFKASNSCGTIHRGMHASIPKPFVLVGDLLPSDIDVGIWEDTKKKVFVSYSHKDDVWCNTFAESLRQKDLDIFYDSDNHSMRSGANWVREIGQAIDQCQVFIIILTPSAWSSEWVQQELNVAFAARREIMPLMLKETHVQGLLRSVQWTDVRGKSPVEAATLLAELLRSAGEPV